MNEKKIEDYDSRYFTDCSCGRYYKSDEWTQLWLEASFDMGDNKTKEIRVCRCSRYLHNIIDKQSSGSKS